MRGIGAHSIQHPLSTLCADDRFLVSPPSGHAGPTEWRRQIPALRGGLAPARRTQRRAVSSTIRRNGCCQVAKCIARRPPSLPFKCFPIASQLPYRVNLQVIANSLNSLLFSLLFGGRTGTRTLDPLIKRHLRTDGRNLHPDAVTDTGTRRLRRAVRQVLHR